MTDEEVKAQHAIDTVAALREYKTKASDAMASSIQVIEALSHDLAAAKERIAELEKKLALCELEIP